MIKETIDKNLSLPATCSDSQVLRACPVFPAVPCTDAPQALAPVNINRDLYIPIWVRGTRFVLVLQETDPQLAEKTKELFWILFTQSVKERLFSRLIYWSLYAVAFLLFAFAFIDNVVKALLGTSLFDHFSPLLNWIGVRLV